MQCLIWPSDKDEFVDACANWLILSEYSKPRSLASCNRCTSPQPCVWKHCEQVLNSQYLHIVSRFVRQVAKYDRGGAARSQKTASLQDYMPRRERSFEARARARNRVRTSIDSNQRSCLPSERPQ